MANKIQRIAEKLLAAEFEFRHAHRKTVGQTEEEFARILREELAELLAAARCCIEGDYEPGDRIYSKLLNDRARLAGILEEWR